MNEMLRHRYRCSFLLALALPLAATAEPTIVGIHFPGKQAEYDRVFANVPEELSKDLNVRLVQIPAKDLQLKLTAFSRRPEPESIQAAGKKHGAAVVVALEADRNSKLLGGSIYLVPGNELLADFALPPKSDEWITTIAAQLARAVKKLDEKGVVRVAIASASADRLPLGHALPVAAFADSLERRLCASPSVVIEPRLEAIWFSALGREVEYAPPHAERRLSLSVSATDDGKFQVTVNVAKKDGDSNPIKLTAENLDATLLNQIAGEIWKAVDAKQPDGKWPADEEFVRHKISAESLIAQRRLTAAIQASEIAFLLDAKDRQARRTLTGCLLPEIESYGDAAKWSVHEKQLFAAHTFQIERQLADLLSASDVKSLEDDCQWPGIAHRSHQMMNIANRMRREMNKDDFAQLYENQKHCAIRPDDVYHELASRNAKYVGDYSMSLARRMHYLCQLKLNDETPQGKLAVDAALRWLELFDKLPEVQQPWSHLNHLLNPLTMHPGMIPDAEVVEPLFQQLEKHPARIMKLFAKRGRVLREKTFKENKAAAIQPVRVEALTVIDEAQKKRESLVVRVAVRFLDETFNANCSRGGNAMAREMMTTYEELLKRKLWTERRMLYDACGLADDLETAKMGHAMLKKYDRSTQGEAKLAKLENRWPDLRTEPAESPVEIKKLFDASELGGHWPLILHPQVRDESIHAIVLSPAGATSTARLFSIPLAKGKPRLVASLTIPDRYGSVYMGREYFVTAVCEDGDSYYAVVRAVGLVAIDLRDGTVSTLVAAKDLPEKRVQTIALAGGQIFLGVEGGKLLRVQLMTGDAETLAATDVATIKTPLDGRESFSIGMLYNDAARKRLLVVIHQKGLGSELWQHDLKTREFQKLHQLARSSGRIQAVGKDELTLLADDWVGKWNFKDNVTTLLYKYAKGGDVEPQRRIFIPSMRNPILCGGGMWWAKSDGSLGKLALPDGKPETHFLNDLEGKPIDSSDRSFTYPIDDKRFLLYHAQRLWLATPKPGMAD